MQLQHQSNILPLTEILPLAKSLARKEAHRPDDVDDLYQEALFAYHKAEQRHLLSGILVEKPWSLARTTMQRAIRGYYWQQREWKGRDEFATAISLDQEGPPPQAAACTLEEKLALNDYFTALEKIMGAKARHIAENLLMPQGDCATLLKCTADDKQEQQALFQSKYRGALRHQPRGVKNEIRITHRAVREALKIPLPEWTRTLESIRDFTRFWFPVATN
jgi:DNA-directed RNA polymerase specialized sigma subunit